ncbi:MAG TPA: hypothetical protein VFY10_06790, partial [Dehalococcoidia bacterium]|nr:hypothetical protein [Dehalococcoidia bacterium]
MNRSFAQTLRPGTRVRSLLAALLLLVIAIAAALMVAQLTMAPPRSDMLELAAYLAASGAVAGLAGWATLNSAWARQHLGRRSKAVLGSLAGGLAALFNVFLIARLMFVSTSHDLYVLAASIGFSLVVMTAFSMTVAASVSQRVELIAQAVRALAAGGQPPILALSEGDEIARLADDVATLSAKLDATERERARLDRQRVELTASI